MAEGSSPPDFGKWFALADLDGDGQISGQEAIPFFTKFDALVKKDLIECWEIADEHKNGFLTLKEFIVAMGVVSLKQAGVKEITSAHVQLLRKGESRGLPTPVLKSGESLGELSADSGATAPGFDFAGSSATANKGKAAATTTSTEQKQNTEVATTSTMTSGRPMLSDDIFAAYEQPPATAATAVPSSSGFDAAPAGSFANNGVSSVPSVVATTASGFGAPPSSSSFGSSFDSSFSAAQTSQAFAAAPIPPAIAPLPTEPTQKWPAMGPSDYQRYQIQFLQNTNNDPNASIPAQVCAPMIAASGLEKHILKQVWEIADARKIGALAWPEFVVGMYLADVMKTRGVQCPEAMPPMPFPPFDQNAAGLFTNNTSSTSMAPPQPQQEQMLASVQVPLAQPETFNFIPGSQLREEFNTVAATASTSTGGDTNETTFTFRGPQLDVSAVPTAERQFAETQFNAAKQADENLFAQETRESENKMSAKAAQEALGNLALFRRKCEANLAEAENKASVAESEANELKKKIEEAKKMCEELIQKSEQSGDDSIATRLEKAREEREVLRAQLEQENAKLRELSGLPTNASNAAEMEREIEIVESDIAKLNNDIALAQKRLQLASKRADLTTQLANVSMAAEKKDREQKESAPPQAPPPSAMTPNGSWEGVQIPPLPPMPTPVPPTPETAKVGFDQWNEWNTTKTLPVAAKPPQQQQQQLQDDLFSSSPPVIPSSASMNAKPTEKGQQQQQQQQQQRSTDGFDFSAPTPRDFAPPAVAAALYSQTNSGGFFSDEETTPNHSRNPSGLDGINFSSTNNSTGGGGEEGGGVPPVLLDTQNGATPAPRASSGVVAKTPENFVDPFAESDEDDDVEDSFDDPFA